MKKDILTTYINIKISPFRSGPGQVKEEKNGR